MTRRARLRLIRARHRRLVDEAEARREADVPVIDELLERQEHEHDGAVEPSSPGRPTRWFREQAG